MIAMAALADTLPEVSRRITLEGDSQDAARRRARTGLEQVGRALSEQLGLARTRTGQNRPMRS
jgi:hypothetical protein